MLYIYKVFEHLKQHGKFLERDAQYFEEGALSSMGSQKPRPELHANTSTGAFVVQEAATRKLQNDSVWSKVLRVA